MMLVPPVTSAAIQQADTGEFEHQIGNLFDLVLPVILRALH